MRFFKHGQRRKTIAFVKSKKAVLGLPMRLMVSIIIGTVALAAIISFVSNPCLFPAKMIVSIEPMVSTINSSHNYTEIDITVCGTDGAQIREALVIIKGPGSVESSYTNEYGKASINITSKLESGANEGYLDVIVKAACHETFTHEDMIKIVRQ